MAERVTLKSVNDELARLGHKATLARAGGYFYFEGPNADAWLDRTVTASTLSSHSLEEWVSEFLRLRKLNSEIMGGGSRASKPKRKAKA